MADRREFLSTASLTVAGLTLAPLTACAREPAGRANGNAPDAARPVEAAEGALIMRKIPSSGESLPAVGVGTSGSYEVPLQSPEFNALKDVVRIFFESGGTVIDTSPNYGNAEDVVGALLADGNWRSKCFLATKLAADDRSELESQWAASLRRLRTDRVELLQVHNLRNLDQALAYARELKAQGATKYIGITHYVESAHAELVRIMRAERPDFVQINYSITSRGAADSVFPVAQELGIAVMVNRAFEDGRLFAAVGDKPLPDWAGEVGVSSWAQMFLKFVISHPAVTTVIAATGKPDRQADNSKAGSGPLLDARQQSDLVSLFA